MGIKQKTKKLTAQILKDNPYRLLSLYLTFIKKKMLMVVNPFLNKISQVLQVISGHKFKKLKIKNYRYYLYVIIKKKEKGPFTDV